MKGGPSAHILALSCHEVPCPRLEPNIPLTIITLPMELEVESPTMSTPQVLHHLYSLNTSSPDFLCCLYCLIQSDEEEEYLSTLQGSELARFVNFLDDVCVPSLQPLSSV